MNKTFLDKYAALFALILFTFLVTFITLSAEYDRKKKQITPAQHSYFFNEQELKKILKSHLKSLGTNVPDGKSEIKGLETHYYLEHKGQLELLIIESKFHE